MRDIIQILLIILITLALVLGISLLGGSGEPAAPPAPEAAEAAPAIASSVPAEASVPETEVTAAALPPETVPAPRFDTVPRYYQTDYPYNKFGNGTIATSGCGMTCLAMVASYLTEQEYLPNQLAHHFGSFGKNNIERLMHGNEQMQLPNTRVEDVRLVLSALEEGKVVIAMMDDESVFTSTQHFIVLAGMTEDGRVIVNDPLEKTHTSADVFLLDGYANGFGTHNIITGFSGAWIYDKAAMPQTPFLFDASLPEEDPHRYGNYRLDAQDHYELTAFAWAVARDEPEEVQQAVMEVILNRVLSDDFPYTVHEVIYSGFYKYTAAMARADVGMPQYRALTAAMYGPYVLPEDVYHFTVWETNGDIWGKLGTFTFMHTKTD